MLMRLYILDQHLVLKLQLRLELQVEREFHGVNFMPKLLKIIVINSLM